MLHGTIDKIGNDLYVKYVDTLWSEPTQKTLWWKILRVERRPMGATFPAVGDALTSFTPERWVARDYAVYVDSRAQAARETHTPVPCPPSRGKPTRWHEGRWERLLAKGWVAL